VASQGTYVAGADAINKWKISSVKVKLSVKADPAKTGWFIDEDGDYLYDGSETEIQACEGFNLGTYSVYLVSVFYSDDDTSGGYTNGDTVWQVVSSDAEEFELTNEPWISGVNPKKFAKGNRVSIIGENFGVEQGSGLVYIGKKNAYNETEGCYFGYCFGGTGGGGKLQDNIKMWSNTKIKIKVKAPASYKNTAKYVWVEKNGFVSNARRINFLSW
jgi:hypothetical protein